MRPGIRRARSHGVHRIVEVERLAPTISRIVVEAPLVARKRQAGHFVIVRLEETGERIPLTIVDASPAGGTITLIVQAIGRTTTLLTARRAGDTIADLVGPLGNPTPLHSYGSIACVGGGVGAAELLPITRALAAVGNQVHTILGARSRDLIILEHELSGCSRSLAVTTDDGSYGRKGLVTDALTDLLAERPLGGVYAIGPLPMMKAVSTVTRPAGIPTWVSLNAIMVDGTGMCGGCRVTIGDQMKFACVDGPEFDGHAVDFDELIRRNRTYVEMERIAAAKGGVCRS
jgi:ferredoxin--NADP+ reductase